MQILNKKKFENHLVVLCFLTLIFLVQPAMSAPTISIAAENHSVNGLLPGNVMLDITASGMSSTLLGGFQLDINFDPNFFAYGGSGVLGSNLGVFNSSSNTEALGGIDFSNPGEIKLYEVSLLDTATLQTLQTTDSYLLAKIRLVTLPQDPLSFPGPNYLGNIYQWVTLNNINSNDPNVFATLYADELGNQVNIDVAGSQTADVISFVPEAPSLALLFIGLLAMGNAGLNNNMVITRRNYA